MGKRIHRSLLVLAALMALTTGCGRLGGIDRLQAGKPADHVAVSGAEGDVTQITIQAERFKFTPTEIRVKQGETVEISLDNIDGYHAIKLAGYNQDVKATRKATFVADKKGEFVYRCTIVCGDDHKEMTGVLIVE